MLSLETKKTVFVGYPQFTISVILKLQLLLSLLLFIPEKRISERYIFVVFLFRKSYCCLR